MEVKHISVADIAIPADRLRAVDTEAVDLLVESIKKVGLRAPITVRPDPTTKGKYDVVTGAHRLSAFAALKYATIPAFVRSGLTDEQAEMEEIVENLHRKELTELERSEQTARWIELSQAPSKAEQDFMGTVEEQKAKAAATKEASAKANTGGRGKKGGINEAARVLPGVTRSGAQRAVKIDGLTPAAKKHAKKLGLDNNQQALLRAAKESGAEAQVKVLDSIAADKGKAKAEQKAAKAKAATMTPVEVHADKASKFVNKVFDAVREKVEAKGIVRADIEALIEHLQSLAEKAPKDRANAVRKLEAQALQSKAAA